MVDFRDIICALLHLQAVGAPGFMPPNVMRSPRLFYEQATPPTRGNFPTQTAANVISDNRNADGGGLSCKICGKTYRGSSGLKVHMQFHTGKFSHWCAQCQKPFTCKGNYDYHMAKHEGRDFPCDRRGCPKRFQSKQNLQRHQLKEHAMEN